MSNSLTKSIKPSARTADTLRVVGATMFAALKALFRRLSGQRRIPSWNAGFDILVASTQGAWSLMSKIGAVRWRNVGEALAPLKTDGLSPQFVDVMHESNVVKGVWLTPPNATETVVLYFHGGGFVFGSLRTHGELIGAIARATRARTFALEYRLAPEHPAPAAIDDAVNSYRFLLSQNLSPAQIVFAGDSAGGNMVITTMLALRALGLPLPAAGVALSPWVDLSCSGESFQRNAAFDYVGEEQCRLCAGHFLQDTDPKQKDLSPLFADLTGLPPMLIHGGASEVLVDQIQAFSERATAAGVDVKLSVFPDMVHVWHMLRGSTPEGQRAIDEVGRYVTDIEKRNQ